jgi:hypothetical protein
MKQSRYRDEVRVSHRVSRLRLQPRSTETHVNQHRTKSIEDVGAELARARDGATSTELSGPLLRSSLWLYLGFIGAAAFGAGLITLVDGAAPHSVAIVLAIAGAVAAPLCWLRARIILMPPMTTARLARDGSFLAGPEITRLGRHAQDCAELAAWPGVGGRTGPLPH